MDLVAAREIFETSQDLTVGIEEEWAIIDPQTLELAPRFEDLRAAGAKDDVLAVAISGELISLARSRSAPAAGRTSRTRCALQREARRRLFALADSHGVALASTGTHPLSDYREQHIIDTEHYRRVQDGLKYVAWRNNTFALQVHVGVQGGDRAVQRLRPPAARPAAAAGDQRQLAVHRRPRLRPALRAHADVHEVLPALRHPGRLRLLAALARLRRPAAAHELDRRVHAAVVVGAPAPLLRHDRGPHLRRADHRAGGRRAGRADRRPASPRRCARSTRARRRPTSPAT